MTEFFATHFAFLTSPEGWAAMVTLIAMEVVLGIDNLIFISILTNKLPAEHRVRARRLGIGAALIMRLVLLATIAYIVGLTAPVFTAFGHGFSWRDLILIAGGLFLVWKATKEIHHTVDPTDHKDDMVGHAVNVSLGGAIFQILLLDLVFSVNSIITAVGMTDHLAIMYIAVIVAITVMLVAATPLANFIEKNPTIVMLALGFLLMIGTTLIADGFGFHVPKGYIYAAMAFSALVEGLNMLARRRANAREAAGQAAAALTDRLPQLAPAGSGANRKQGMEQRHATERSAARRAAARPRRLPDVRGARSGRQRGRDPGPDRPARADLHQAGVPRRRRQEGQGRADRQGADAEGGAGREGAALFLRAPPRQRLCQGERRDLRGRACRPSTRSISRSPTTPASGRRR